jgi:hypothetical protein
MADATAQVPGYTQEPPLVQMHGTADSKRSDQKLAIPNHSRRSISKKRIGNYLVDTFALSRPTAHCRGPGRNIKLAEAHRPRIEDQSSLFFSIVVVVVVAVAGRGMDVVVVCSVVLVVDTVSEPQALSRVAPVITTAPNRKEMRDVVLVMLFSDVENASRQ